MSDEPYNAGYDEDAAAYDELRGGWMRHRRVDTFERSLSGAADGDVVCELGSGTGAVLTTLAARHPTLRFVGVEPIAAYVEFAQERAADRGLDNVTFEVGTAETVGERGLRDVRWWCSSDVLHHVADEGATVDAVTASSAPDSSWTIIEPNPLNAYVGLYQARTAGERNFRPGRFGERLRRAGWTVARREYMFLLPSSVRDPAPWLQRIERVAERVPVVGGGVVLRCSRGG